MAQQAKGNSDNIKVGVLLGIIVLAGVGRWRLSSRGGTTTSATRTSASGRGAIAPHGGASSASASGGQGSASAGPKVTDPNKQITIRPEQIPELSQEVRNKLLNKGIEGQGLYPEARLAEGFNPFLPFEVNETEIVGPIVGKSTEKKVTRTFNRKITFYGAFTTGDETRAIIEIEEDPIPQTRLEGELIEGTPYYLQKISPDGKTIHLSNPRSPDDSPEIPVVGSDSNVGRTGQASNLFRQQGRKGP